MISKILLDALLNTMMQTKSGTKIIDYIQNVNTSNNKLIIIYKGPLGSKS